MTWQEIKAAVEATGIQDSDEIRAIMCETYDGAQSFHTVTIGTKIKLVQDRLEHARQEASGCAG